MQKQSYFPAVLMGLVISVMVLAACSGPAKTVDAPVQTAPGNTPVAAGNCKLALLLPGRATDDIGLQTGVGEAADQKGCQLEVYAAEDSPEKMAADINEAAQKKVVGMIIKPIDHADVEAAVQQTSKQGLPVIVIGAAGLPAVQTNRVVPDFVDGARKAAGFVCGAIHERGNIVQLADSGIDGADGRVSKAFADGIQSTCPEAKLTTVTVQDSGEDAAKKAMLQILSTTSDISAVFAYTESAMNGAVSANQEAGILGVITSEFGQESGTASEDPIRAVDAVLRASGSETGKAAVQAVLAQSNGVAAQPQIAVTMQISVSDISLQLPSDPTAKPLTIGVILPDGNDPFYEQLYRGLRIPARSLDNVTLKVRSGNNDPQRMIQELDWMVSIKVDAILLSPVEDPALLIAIDRVARSGTTPLVTMGVALGIDKIVSQISFDEYAAGYKAGEYLCAALGGKGTIADVYDSANLEKEAVRSRGLKDFQQENCPEVKIITQALPTGSEPACQGLQKFLSEAGPVAGIFAHSDKLGLCAVDSSPKVEFVIGIGTSTEAIESIKAGKLSATLGQYPSEMGQIAMETTIEYLYGKPVEPSKPFPVNLITRDILK